MKIALLMVALLAAPAAGRQQTDTAFAVQPGGQLRLENHQGSIRVTSWDRQEMRIRASHSSQIRIAVRSSGGVVRVSGEARQGPPHGIDYEITVPRSFRLTLSGVYSEIAIQNVDGAVRAENVQGDIVVRGGTGPLNLESVEGEISISQARGRVIAQTVNRGIRLRDVSGDVSADAVNGAIELLGINSSRVAATSVNGNIQFQGVLRDAGRYSLATHNGSITIAVPAGTNASVSVATHSGNVEADFPVELHQSTDRGRLTFRLGNGSARIDLQSFGGSIRLVRPSRNR